MLKRFDGNTYKTHDNIKMGTNEGPAAVEELIKYLEEKSGAEDLHPLLWSEPLAKASTNMALAQGPTGGTGHTGPDGSTMSSRITDAMKLFGQEWEATIGENIMYRSGSPLMAVLNLAIDDGVASRGHRTNIFKDSFYYTGAGTEPHKIYESETVVTYSGSYSL